MAEKNFAHLDDFFASTQNGGLRWQSVSDLQLNPVRVVQCTDKHGIAQRVGCESIDRNDPIADTENVTPLSPAAGHQLGNFHVPLIDHNPQISAGSFNQLDKGCAHFLRFEVVVNGFISKAQNGIKMQ